MKRMDFDLFRLEDRVLFEAAAVAEIVEAAEAVQENPKISVGDAACLVGYHDEKYFAKVFLQREGISFSEYKKQEAHRIFR